MNKMNDIVITATNVSKKYYLGEEKHKQTLLSDEIAAFFKKTFKKSKQAKAKPFLALKNINFEIKRGEAIGIIGPNGAGKSTLLKILSRITSPTTGEIKIQGRIASLLEIGTGFNPELTGRENVYLNGAILGMSKKEIQSKFDEIVQFAEIIRFIDIPVKKYSSGMYIRLAFSIAAHLDPDILIVDEVLAVGDARFQKKSLGKMNEVTKKDGRTLLFVSHDLNTIKRICSRTMLIDDGEIVTFGKTDKVINKYLGMVNENVPNAGGTFDKNSKRQGSGEIKINNIYITNDKGKIVKMAKSGDDIFIHLGYEAKQRVRIEKLLVGLLVKTEIGQPVFLTHNIMNGFPFSDVKGSGEFVVTIKKTPLTSGTYYVNYSLMKNNGISGEYYDNIDDAFSLVVEPGDFFGTSILPPQTLGASLVVADWKMIKNENYR